MEFGDLITLPEPGVRPAWLADPELVIHFQGGLANGISRVGRLSWEKVRAPYKGASYPVTHINLPADHFAYIAIAKGFEPWPGGLPAPDGWDGGEVLLSDGVISRDYASRRCAAWTRLPGDLANGHLRIIGYRKREETAPAVGVPIGRHVTFLMSSGEPEFLKDNAGDRRWMPIDLDNVRPLAIVKKMTGREAEQRFNEVTGWPASRMIGNGLVDFLASLGLIVEDRVAAAAPAVRPAYFHLGAEAE